MKVLFIIGFLVFGLTSVFGQGAFDPDCYFPTLGVTEEIDSVYGSKDQQHLGAYMLEFPPSKDTPEGNIAISGIPNSPPFLSLVSKKAPFPLHKLQANAKKSNLVIKDSYVFGHFRDSKHIDLLVKATRPRIYWADENGEFDSGRTTLLLFHKEGEIGRSQDGDIYCANLTSDTVLDIIQLGVTSWFDPTPDSVFLIHFAGGQAMYAPRDTVYSDSARYVGPTGNISLRYLQGDFRGTGRDDLITSDKEGNWFFYRNDAPFSLERFAQAVYHDTLMAKWENAYTLPVQYADQILANAQAIRLLPHQAWDKSQDIVIGVTLNNSGNAKDFSKLIFRTGPLFGNSRIYMSDAKEILRNPYYYDNTMFWILNQGPLIDCGDVTNTGVSSFLSEESYPGYYLQFLYNSGKALDDKADMYYIYETQGGLGDVVALDADGDEYGDVLISDDANTSQEDVDEGKGYVGTIHLVHGSPKIPVRLNPKYAVKNHRTPASNLNIYPNPAHDKTIVNFTTEISESVEFRLLDLLGREIEAWTIYSSEGWQSIPLYVSGYPSGSYVLELRTSTSRTLYNFLIIH